MEPLHSINQEQRLYVLKCGGGYSCLGFDVAERWRVGVLNWMGMLVGPITEVGTRDHFGAYEYTMKLGQEHAAKTGKQCPALLTASLVGREGKRVEVIEPGEKPRRFIVGRSTGWMPIHLEIAHRGSSGGIGTYISDKAIVRTIAESR